MLARTIQITLLFAALSLLTACDPPQVAPTKGVEPVVASPPSPVSTFPPAPAPTPTSAFVPTYASIPEPSSLTEEIPPCTPVLGSSVDPCEPGVEQYSITAGGASSSGELGDEPQNVRELLEPVPGFVSHIVIRGTYLPNTVRCTTGDLLRLPSFWRDEAVYTANSRAVKCYVDVQVGAYALGNGPSILTVLRFWYTYWDGWLDQTAADEGTTAQEYIEGFRQLLETDDYVGGIVGREEILFLGPATSLSAESLQVFQVWDVQRREDDTVVAVHPDRDLWRRYKPDDYQTHLSALEMELPAFTQAVTTANQARVTEYGGRIGPETDLPMLLINANQLRQYYTAVGAYNHPDGPPAQPPPPCRLAVPNQTDNPGLMADCQSLFAASDTLRGTATLNWSVDMAITSWDGVTTGGTPSRVTELDLSSESLTGSIPSGLGSLSELTTLDLSSNSLTGEIPRELGGLSNLTEIRLSGNSLTGCIPIGLKDVTTNDLSSLNLLYCPPAPEGLSTGTIAENSIPHSWRSVSGATKYRVEYRDAYSLDWTVDDDTITGTTHTVDELQCEMWHQFRVSAYGNGTTYAADWSDSSAVLTETTGTCAPPASEPPSTPAS